MSSTRGVGLYGLSGRYSAPNLLCLNCHPLFGACLLAWPPNPDPSFLFRIHPACLLLPHSQSNMPDKCKSIIPLFDPNRRLLRLLLPRISKKSPSMTFSSLSATTHCVLCGCPTHRLFALATRRVSSNLVYYEMDRDMDSKFVAAAQGVAATRESSVDSKTQGD